jgi:nucleoside-diphosphate-sugar epimerase
LKRFITEGNKKRNQVDYNFKRKILVTGAGGYVGSKLVPALISKDYKVLAVDTYWYGEKVFKDEFNEKLKVIKLDIRNQEALRDVLSGVTDVIHLACISNDPSFDLNPQLGKSINLDAFEPLVNLAKESGVQRFIYASSSSVYGVKEELRVTEGLSLNPLTDYSKYKMICEEILSKYVTNDFVGVTLRPATVCGWSPRQRFDLSVNILTNLAVNKNEITVFGGTQFRPNIHIDDMVQAYLLMLESPTNMINGSVFNVGSENLSLNEIAIEVSKHTNVENIIHTSTNDLRSYRVDSQKICNQLGFRFQKTVADAIKDIVKAFRDNKYSDSLNNPLYFNIKRMQQLGLS